MDFGQVKVTRSKFYRISGASTQHRGVIPDISFPDFYDAYDDIGESSLDGALPWDTVRPVEYRPYYSISAMLPQLQEQHNERIEESPDFNYLIDQIERTRRYREREQISLNEEKVKAERESNRREEFDAENMRRFLKGLPLREWEDEEADEEEVISSVAAADDSDLPSGEDTQISENDEIEEDDPLLLESGRILADFIALNGRRLSSIDRLPGDR